MLLAQLLLFSGTGQLQWKCPIYFSWFRCTKKTCKEDEPEARKWPIKHFNYMLFTCYWHLAFNSFIYYKASERESHQRLRTHCVEHKIIIERFCSCMDLLDFIKILVQISRTWPAKLIRVTWRRLRLQILMWELEGLDPQYVVPTDIYPIHY